MEILAREREKRILSAAEKSGRPEFIVVYGRRRVGKTYLIRNFFNTHHIFHLTGTPKQKRELQLQNFFNVFCETFGDRLLKGAPESWEKAFDTLRKQVEQVPGKERIVLFFDELPWLATKKSGFVEALSYAWNRYLEANPRIIVVVCGSAASWMIDNVISSRGGLYNRTTRQIRLQPLDLHDTEVYLKAKGVHLSRKQIIELYMAIGGVPAYLDNVVPGRSSAQLICDICFDPSSPLHGEFDRIFHAMFSKSELHTRVIRQLLSHREGITNKELFKRAGIASGSVQQRVKRELVESGFIAEIPDFGALKRGSLIRLVDEYTIFFLTWRNELLNSRHPVDLAKWMSLQNTPRWRTWTGLAFEGICHNHIVQIARGLGIAGIHYTHHMWRFDDRKKRAQIDLLIDRADKCINLCEIKFYDREFVITAEYAKRLEAKRDLFKDRSSTSKVVFTTMISCNGVKENQHYLSAVDNQLTKEHLFAEL